MDHTHYQELTSQFIDRELGAAGEQELFRHMGSCDACRLFLRTALTMNQDILATKDKMVSIDSPSMNSVASRFLFGLRADRMFKRVWRAQIPAPVAFGMAVVLVAVGLIVSMPKQDTSKTQYQRVPEARAVLSMPTIVITQK